MATAVEAPANAEGLTSHTQNQPEDAARARQERALARLVEPFDEDQISTRAETDCNACKSNGGVCGNHYLIDCAACGRVITVAHTDLRYVDHAETTARILEVDPFWGWEPMALTREGLPLVDEQGGLWIKLTIAGVTRLGYGEGHSMEGTDAVKARIGDAIRNGGMRFGMSLDLWKTSDRRAREKANPRPGGFPERDGFRLRQLAKWARTYWGRPDDLRKLHALVFDEGFDGALIPDAGNTMLGPAITDRIAELASRSSAPATSDATAPGEDSQDTGAPAPGETPEASEAPGTDDTPDAGAAPAPDVTGTGGPDLARMVARVANHWDKPLLLEQDLVEVRRLGLQDHNVECPPNWGGWLGFEALINRRLDEHNTIHLEGNAA